MVNSSVSVNITSVLFTNPLLVEKTSGLLLTVANFEYQFQIPDVTGGVIGGEGVRGVFWVLEVPSSEDKRLNMGTSPTPR